MRPASAYGSLVRTQKRCVSWDVHIRVEVFKENAPEEKLNTTLPC